MKWIYNILLFCLGLAALAGVLFLIATAWGWDKIWVSRFGPADMGAVKFEGLAKGPKPNQALVCPDGICADKDRDRTSPVFPIPVRQLKALLLKSLDSEKGLERVDNGSDPMSMRFVQRSRLLRFPDTIRVRFYNLGNNRSTLAIYSQSQIGKYDFGVNSNRLDRWLDRLEEAEKPLPRPAGMTL